MTMVFDPIQPMACSAQLDGGAMTFMSPELLVPQEFGKEYVVPTPQADIYAFGLVIFQVRQWDFGYHLFLCIPSLQVLTGESPFRGVPQSALGYAVVHGRRPDKPDNASVIGFSDPLWYFTQRCWDGKIEVRPKVGEVVTHLREAAAGWDGLTLEPTQCRESDPDPLDSAHQAMVQTKPSHHLRPASRRVPSNHPRSSPNPPRIQSTTFREQEFTRISTSGATLPHPSFPGRNGKTSCTTSRSSSGTPAVGADFSSLSSTVPDLTSYLIARKHYDCDDKIPFVPRRSPARLVVLNYIPHIDLFCSIN